MSKFARIFLTGVLAVGLGVGVLPAGASHNADQHSPNMEMLDIDPQTAATNSDLAFWGNRLYAGNFNGFRIFDITNPANPALVTNLNTCPGGQADPTVWNNDGDPAADLLFLSVDSPRTSPTCGAGGSRAGASTPAVPSEWEGIRIFDINTETAPVQIAAVPLDCGSHTHTLVPGQGAGAGFVYLYNSSYPLGKAAVTTDLPNSLRDDGTECVEPEPPGPGVPTGNGKAHDKISIVRVNLSAPATADDATGTPPNLTYPNVKEVPLDLATLKSNITLGDGFGGLRSYDFSACHDISVFMELNIASASCWREAQFWDITDPFTPDFLRRIRNDAEIDTIFHSTTFTWDGNYVALEDEAGGGGDDRCRDPNDTQGRILFYNFSAQRLGSFKIPRAQPKGEICTAHLYNYVPQTNQRDVLVSSWYFGGTSVADTTNPGLAKEIGFYDAQTPVPGGPPTSKSNVWASYWYNGYIYVNDIGRGVETYRFNDARVEDAVTLPFFNPQTFMNVINQVSSRCDKRNANIFGTSEADTLTGDDVPEVYQALGGNDIVGAEGGNDRVCGGDHNDKLRGQGNSDRVFGEKGKDRLNGGLGNDLLVGGPGRDVCVGGPGKDRARKCEREIGIER